MFILNRYKKQNIFVGHINYHKRKDSNIDENIVRIFCNSYKIPFKILNVKEKPVGNFQSWAREVRYNFFKKIYIKQNCTQLVIAHHKDDFLETALMQQESGRNPRFLGIKKRNIIKGMNIYRPLINKYWKDKIIKYLDLKQINYAIDYTNKDPIFFRNKIRIHLLTKTKKQKNKMYKEFQKKNKLLKHKFKKIDLSFKEWKNSNYKVKKFKVFYYKEEIIFKYINSEFFSIKLSKGKINSLIDFIESNNSEKIFKLNNKNSLIKQEGYIKKYNHL